MSVAKMAQPVSSDLDTGSLTENDLLKLVFELGELRSRVAQYEADFSRLREIAEYCVTHYDKNWEHDKQACRLMLNNYMREIRGIVK